MQVEIVEVYIRMSSDYCGRFNETIVLFSVLRESYRLKVR